MPRRWLRGLRPDGEGERLVARCEPATLAAAEVELGRPATAWAVQAAASAARSTLVAASGPDLPAGLLAPVQRVCEACVLAVLRGLAGDLPPDDVVVPDEAVRSARDALHAGLALERLLRTMWNAHVVTVDLLTAAVQAAAEPGVGWDEVRRLSRVSFAYVDAFSERIAREYDTEREAWLGSVAAERRRVVAALLERRPVDAPAAERTLGVRLTDTHVAVVVWSEHGEATPDQHLLGLVSALARAAGASNELAVHGALSGLWVWLAVPARDRGADGPDLPGRLRDHVVPQPGLRAALGPAAAGAEGFRRSHLAAREAQRLAGLSGSWLVDHAEIAVASLLTMNTEHADWFAADILGRLGAADRRTIELQETLLAYLAAGRSRTAVAAQLHVAPGTVAYRVRQAEELLSRPTTGMGREIQIALEIVRARRATDPSRNGQGPHPS